MLRKRRIPRWLKFALPIVALVLGYAAWSALPYVVPFGTLFRWSRPSLDAYAAKVMAPGSTALDHPPGRLGFFHVLKTERLPHGFLLQHDSCNPFDWCGIAYSTEPLPEFDKDDRGEVKQVFRPLGGNWYDVFRP